MKAQPCSGWDAGVHMKIWSFLDTYDLFSYWHRHVLIFYLNLSLPITLCLYNPEPYLQLCWWRIDCLLHRLFSPHFKLMVSVCSLFYPFMFVSLFPVVDLCVFLSSFRSFIVSSLLFYCCSYQHISFILQ